MRGTFVILRTRRLRNGPETGRLPVCAERQDDWRSLGNLAKFIYGNFGQRVRGRPGDRSVCCNPSCLAIAACHASAPEGRLRREHTRTQSGQLGFRQGLVDSIGPAGGIGQCVGQRQAAGVCRVLSRPEATVLPVLDAVRRIRLDGATGPGIGRVSESAESLKRRVSGSECLVPSGVLASEFMPSWQPLAPPVVPAETPSDRSRPHSNYRAEQYWEAPRFLGRSTHVYHD
jgi:hypothetical protein